MTQTAIPCTVMRGGTSKGLYFRSGDLPADRETRDAVLLAATDKGELVLDNLNTWLLFWNQTNYQWNQREAGGQAFDWVSVASAPSAAAPGSIQASR